MKNTTTLAAALAMAVPAFAQTSDEELVMQLANPVASLISVPFQSNFDFGMGPLDKGTQYRLSFQPVIPVSMNKDWNLIIRTIVPYVSPEDVFPDVHQDGLSDIVQSFFLSPNAPVGGLDPRLWPGAALSYGDGQPARHGEMGCWPDRAGAPAERRLDLRRAREPFMELRRQRGSPQEAYT